MVNSGARGNFGAYWRGALSREDPSRGRKGRLEGRNVTEGPPEKATNQVVSSATTGAGARDLAPVLKNAGAESPRRRTSRTTESPPRGYFAAGVLACTLRPSTADNSCEVPHLKKKNPSSTPTPVADSTAAGLVVNVEF